MLVAASLCLCVQASTQTKYNRKSQEKLIPQQLGKIFMGMDLKAFQQLIPMDSAELDSRFEELRVMDIPINKGNIQSIQVKFSGLSMEEKEALQHEVEIIKKVDEAFSYPIKVQRIIANKLPAKGKLYEIYILFKKGFDAEAFVKSLYGPSKDVAKPGEYYFYDIQWTRRTNDDLGWIIRYFRESNMLLLASTMPGSEWSVE